MSLFFSDFIHTRTDLTQKISDIQQQLKQLPHGKLIISHNGENTPRPPRAAQIT